MAYFGEASTMVWLASRGFGGKSYMLALLSLVEAVAGMGVAVLGGSLEQSQNVTEYLDVWTRLPRMVPYMGHGASTKTRLKLTSGGWVRALAASSKSVRGPHPQRLRLDEVDEMDLSVLDSAMGQPMAKGGFSSQVVLSSTRQYPDGTMAEILKRAKAKGWPVCEWSYRETMEAGNTTGWVTDAMLEEARGRVTANMWVVEYENQEPSVTGRAIESEKVAALFDEGLGDWAGDVDQVVWVEEPRDDGDYVVGADWARDQHHTVIKAFEVLSRDPVVIRLVAYLKTHRRPYPEMTAMFDHMVAYYDARGCHDATGVGGGIRDFFAETTQRHVEDVTMVGRARRTLFVDYVAAIEAGRVMGPMIRGDHRSHLYVTEDDLRERGGGHPPDDVVAGAMAYRAAKHLKPGRSTYKADGSDTKRGKRTGGSRARALKRARSKRPTR